MKNRFLIYLFAIVLFTSCHTSKEILNFQDIAVNQPEAMWVQETSPCSPRTKFPSSKDPQLAAVFNLTRVQYRAGTADLRSSNNNGEISGYTLDDKGNIDFPVIGSLHIAGMTKSQIFFMVVLLLVVKRIVTPMGNEFISLVKDTALSRIIGIYEIIYAGESYIKKGLFWPLFYTAAFYLVFYGVLTVLFAKLEKKLNYFRG